MAHTYVFDAYGTLFDVHSAVSRHSALAGAEAVRLSQIWRTKQLEYTWTRTAMGRYRDFQALTVEALDYALAAVPGAHRDARDALLDAYRTLDSYTEVHMVLSALKAQGNRLAILSNGTASMLRDAVASARLGELLDDIISTDEIAMFKTAPQAYALVTDRYRVEPGEVFFQSSNRWDIAGATAFGFVCNWINRTGQPDEYADLPPARVLADLKGLL
jgi:2-haloacid dehalogenase